MSQKVGKPIRTVALDAQPLHANQKTGHGYYVESLWDALENIDHPDIRIVPCAPSGSGRMNTLRRLWWDQIAFPRMARRAGADILCTTAFSVPLFSSRKRVAVVHDLSLMRFPGNMRGVSGWFLRRFVPWTFRKADRIVAVSGATKRDLVELLHIKQERITVVYEGVSQFYRPLTERDATSLIKKWNLSLNGYFLCVGTLEPRKNLPFLLEALAVFLKDARVPLVLAGKRGWQHEEIWNAIRDQGLEDLVIEAGYVSDEEKRGLYSGAIALLYPSLYEGFGLPLLESMACGCPVLSANNSCLPEVVGDAGMLLPLEKNQWRDAVKEIFSNGSLRGELSKRGIDQAARFSWVGTAQGMLDIYRDV